MKKPQGPPVLLTGAELEAIIEARLPTKIEPSKKPAMVRPKAWETIKLHDFCIGPKPDWCLSVDVAVMSFFIASGYGAYPHGQIATACGIGTHKSIQVSTKRLRDHGWLRFEVQEASGKPNIYTVLLKSLP